MRYILLIMFFLLMNIYVIAQSENDKVFHATIPTKFYTQIQTGLAVPSLQDLKVSNIHWLGSGFTMNFGLGYEGEKALGALDVGFYNGILSSFNRNSILIRNFHPMGTIQYQRKVREFKKQKIDWWTGGEIDAFYDLRRNNVLDNNQNIEVIMLSAAWKNSFRKDIKIKDQKYKLFGAVTLPLVGYIGESQSFSFNIPTESFVNGVYNYQSFTPSTVASMKLVPIGQFLRLKTNVGIEKTFELDGYNKKKLIKISLNYNWDYLVYQQSPNSRLQLANHQLLISFKYHLTKRNHAGYPRKK